MNLPRAMATVAVAALALAACGNDSSDDGGAYAGTSAPADAASTTTSDAGGAAGTEGAVTVATDPDLGDHLVDAGGSSLYLFEQDEGTTTACTGACASTWPPLVADGAPTGSEGVAADELSTAEGIEADQVTYHGHLLYYFSGDSAPGDTNGTGIPDWYLVTPGGEPLGET